MKTVALFVAAVLVVLLAVPLGTACGALAAMIVEWWFPVLMHKVAGMAGFDRPWELGAALGFIGAFFKSTHYSAGK